MPHDFDLQTYLEQWRIEQRSDMHELRSDVQKGRERMEAIDQRVSKLESVYGFVKWMGITVIGAVVSWAVALFTPHRQ